MPEKCNNNYSENDPSMIKIETLKMNKLIIAFISTLLIISVSL